MQKTIKENWNWTKNKISTLEGLTKITNKNYIVLCSLNTCHNIENYK